MTGEKRKGTAQSSSRKGSGTVRMRPSEGAVPEEYNASKSIRSMSPTGVGLSGEHGCDQGSGGLK